MRGDIKDARRKNESICLLYTAFYGLVHYLPPVFFCAIIHTIKCKEGTYHGHPNHL